MTFLSQLSRAHNRRITSVLAALSLISYSAFLMPAQAQTPVQPQTPTQPNRSDMPDKPKKEDTTPKKPESLPPGNPAVLLDSNSGNGLGANDLNKDGTPRIKPQKNVDYGDHKSRPGDPRISTDPDDLPIYGYSYFAWARRAVQIHQRQFELKYGGDDTGTSSTMGTHPSKSGAKTSASSRNVTRRPSGPFTAEAPDEADTSAPRRIRRSTDSTDPTDSTDTTNGDGTDSTPTRKRVTSADETDSTGNTDNSYPTDDPALAAALRAEDLQHEQRRRQLMGLPPLDTANTRSTNATNASGSGRHTTTNIAPRRSDQTDTVDDNTTDRQSGQRQSAYNSIITPLDQFERNFIASPPANYQLGGGDELIIHISTPKLPPRNLTRRVDDTGYVDLDDMGRYIVRGKSLDQVQKDLQQRVGRFYRGADVSVSLNYLRTISVTLQGEVVLPGAYVVPAISTAFNVLYFAGGPTEDGSLREIKVIRQGKEVGNLDFYKFMAGKLQSDIPLQGGDVIFVAPAGARVAILGEVRHPARYEMRDDETLKDLISYSGGVKASGADQIVQLNTVEPGQNRVLKNINLREKELVGNVHLFDGDSIEIHSLRQIVENKVTIRGAVTQPGDYALTPNMHVAELLRLARNPVNEAYLARAALKRWNADNTTTLIPIDLSKAMAGDSTENRMLMKWDTLEIYTQEEAAFVGTRRVLVSGAVSRPGNYEYSQNMHLSDILLKAGGVLQDAERIELIHQRGDHTVKYEPVRVADVVHGDKAHDLLVEDNDIVAVYSNRQAGFIPDHKVRIEGEVVTTGWYARGEDMHLTDLIRLAGRFKPGASPKVMVAHSRRAVDNDISNAVVTIRFDSNQQCAPQDDIRLEDGDVVTVQGTGGIEEHPALVRVIGAVNNPGPIILKNRTVHLSDAIKDAGGLRPEAFPEGAEFNRDPNQLNSKTQRDLAAVVGQLSDLLNDSRYKAELAKSDIERAKAFTSIGSDSPVGASAAASSPATAALAQKLGDRSLVTAPRRLVKELDPSGNLAINLPLALEESHKGANGEHDILLKDGDTIIVPEKPTTVQVIGAVTNPRGILFAPGKPVNYYVSQAGDYTPDAAKDRIIVIHYGGGIIAAKDLKELRPGDMILVPTRVLAEKIRQNGNGFNDFFKSITNSAILFRLSTGIFGL